jgi:cystathionine beta-lyase/cystathionine gamma-synthase
LGGILGAFEAWLALRGVRTLPLRMRQACGSALKLAEWMRGHPRISRVYYPGLPDDPCHDDTRRLFREGYFGAMMAFAVEGLDREAAFRLMEGLRLIRPITSLGDLNTLVSHPATSSHRALSAEQRLAQGITEGTLRLSVGIEDPDDLIADLDQTLAAAG